MAIISFYATVSKHQMKNLFV